MIHSILHKALRNAVRWNKIVRNLCDMVKLPYIPDHEMRVLTVEEARRLLHFSGRGMNGRTFGEEMSKRFTRVEVNGSRMYRGIGLLTPDDDPSTLFAEVEGGLLLSTTDRCRG